MKSNIKRQHFHICYHFHLHTRVTFTSVTFTRRWPSRSLSGFAFSTHNLVTLLFGYSVQWYVSTFSTQYILSSSIHQRGRSICRIFLVTDRRSKMYFRVLELPVWAVDVRYLFSTDQATKGEKISVSSKLVFWKLVLQISVENCVENCVANWCFGSRARSGTSWAR